MSSIGVRLHRCDSAQPTAKPPDQPSPDTTARPRVWGQTGDDPGCAQLLSKLVQAPERVADLVLADGHAAAKVLCKLGISRRAPKREGAAPGERTAWRPWWPQPPGSGAWKLDD